MSGIVLSASVRQNLLSLQSTADLLSTTQNRLATGKKVNSALDNPTNFFTAASLNSRASDINNLLDGIGNGVQILQAANTGISSLNKLVDTAKSLANQALQTTAGYTQKSNVSTTIAGATADDLRGTTSFTNATAASSVVFDGTAGGTTGVGLTDTLGGSIGTLTGSTVLVAGTVDATATAGSTLFTGGSTPAATGSTLISALTNNSVNSPTGPVAGDSFTVDGKTVTFIASGAANKDSSGNYTIGIDQTLTSLLATVDTINGNTTNASGLTAGGIVLHTGTDRSLVLADGTSGTLAKLGLTAGTTNLGATATSTTNIASSTKLFNTVGALSTSNISDGTQLTVNGKTITFKASAAPIAADVPAGSGVLGNVLNDGNGNSTIYLGTSTTFTSATVADVENAIDLASGVKSATNTAGVAAYTTNTSQTASSVGSGAVTLKSSTGADLSVSGPADL